MSLGAAVEVVPVLPVGGRLSQISHQADAEAGVEAGETAYYGYNAHTDVETLIDESGNTTATYGHIAYGSDDSSEFTGIDKPEAGDPTQGEAYHGYRYNSKRLNAGSGTYDMGFRDYDPGLNRFTSRDMYNGALADMGLGADPYTGNRYAFTAGNPINLIELDGHRLSDPSAVVSGSTELTVNDMNAMREHPEETIVLDEAPSTPLQKWFAEESSDPDVLSGLGFERPTDCEANSTDCLNWEFANNYLLVLAPGAATARGAAALESAASLRGAAAAGSGAAVEASRVASSGAHALPAFPKALSGGRARTHVHLGVRDGKSVYVGITNNLARRQAQHGERFALEPITNTPLIRGQARAIEQALIVRNGSTFENKINSISPTHAHYDDSVNWGEAWLKQNGY